MNQSCNSIETLESTKLCASFGQFGWAMGSHRNQGRAGWPSPGDARDVPEPGDPATQTTSSWWLTFTFMVVCWETSCLNGKWSAKGVRMWFIGNWWRRMVGYWQLAHSEPQTSAISVLTPIGPRVAGFQSSSTEPPAAPQKNLLSPSAWAQGPIPWGPSRSNRPWWWSNTAIHLVAGSVIMNGNAYCLLLIMMVC